MWTLRPRQRGTETLHEVIQAPGDDGVIIESNIERHNGRGKPCNNVEEKKNRPLTQNVLNSSLLQNSSFGEVPLAARLTDASTVRRDEVPGSDRSFPQSLTNSQLHIKDWKTFDSQHDEVGDEEGS